MIHVHFGHFFCAINVKFWKKILLLIHHSVVMWHQRIIFSFTKMKLCSHALPNTQNGILFECQIWLSRMVFCLFKKIYIFIYVKKHSFYYTDLCLFLDGAFVRFGYMFSIYIHSKLFQANIQFTYICVLLLCVHTCSHFFFLLLHAYNAFDISKQQTRRIIKRQLWPITKNNNLICI